MFIKIVELVDLILRHGLHPGNKCLEAPGLGVLQMPDYFPPHVVFAQALSTNVVRSITTGDDFVVVAPESVQIQLLQGAKGFSALEAWPTWFGSFGDWVCDLDFDAYLEKLFNV